MPDMLQKFMQLTKVDVAKRLIYGTFTAEVVDKSGEVADYEGTKAAIMDWSKEIEKVSKGKSKGNIRKMHGKEVVGKAVEITCDDVNKTVSGCVEVDEKTVQEAEKGILNGFSIGGAYVKKWACPVNKGKTRFIPTIAEISVVDNPCVPDAVFAAIKDAEFAVIGADGVEVMRKFAPKDEPELELKQVWKAGDGSEHETEELALAKNAEIKAAKIAAPVLDALAKADPEMKDEEEAEDKEKPKKKKAEGDEEEDEEKDEKKSLKLARNADGTLTKSVLDQVLEFTGVTLEGLQKGDIPDDTAELTALKKVFDGLPAQIEAKIEPLLKRIKHLESLPAADTVQLRTVLKGGDETNLEKSETPVYLGSHSAADFHRLMNRN